MGEDVLARNQARSVIDRVFPRRRRSELLGAARAAWSSTRGPRVEGARRHLLGTDILGRDVLHRLLKGARVALLVGGLTSLIAIPLALLLGVSAGYFGGRCDDFVFFVMSTLASMPSLLLLIALIMVLGRGPGRSASRSA